MATVVRILLLVGNFIIFRVEGHGYLAEPAGRASLWRTGVAAPQDYNDNECSCGGIDVQWEINEGRCGVCGDPWNETVPRKHKAGGPYAKGVLSGRYKVNQVITATVQLTATHMGYFEFRICPNNNISQEVTQECLNSNVLQLADGSGTHFQIPKNEHSFTNYKIKLQLLYNMTCKQCVLQWNYNTGNRWGTCDDGSMAVGCGHQETFRACADISITGVKN